MVSRKDRAEYPSIERQILQRRSAGDGHAHEARGHGGRLVLRRVAQASIDQGDFQVEGGVVIVQIARGKLERERSPDDGWAGRRSRSPC